MTLSERIIDFTRNAFDTALFFAVMAVKEDFRNYVKRAGAIDMAPSGEILLLANGASLASELPGHHRTRRPSALRRAGCQLFCLR